MMNLIGLTGKKEHTLRRSRPVGDRFGTARAKFSGFHWGYSCQSLRRFTPGHISSVGVPSNLSTTNANQLSSFSNCVIELVSTKTSFQKNFIAIREDMKQLLYFTIPREKWLSSHHFSYKYQDKILDMNTPT